MDIKTLNSKIRQQMEGNSISQTQLISQDLLCFVLKTSREYLFSYPGKKLTPKQIKTTLKYTEQIINGQPLAYIRNYAFFYGRKFFLNRHCLIPRPETELLVESALEYANKIPLKTSQNINIADIGTGSGAIIITIAKELPNRIFKFSAVEKYQQTLNMAKKNAEYHQVNSKINFYKGNLLQPLPRNNIDLLLANLPYLSDLEYQKSPYLKRLKYEPKTALTSREQGLFLIKKLIKNSPKYLNKNARIILEIGYDQAEQLKKYAKQIYPSSKIIIKKDLCSFYRVLIIKTKQTNIINKHSSF